MLKLNKKNTRHAAGALAAVFAFASLAGTAAAIVVPPSYTYPGQMCQSHDTDMRYQLDNVSNNSATATLAAQCPIPNTWSGSIEFARVRVVDMHPTQNFTCAIFALIDTLPQGNGWWVTRSSAGAGFTVQDLNFTKIGNAGSNHYFNMACTMPARSNGAASFLKSYYIFEK